MTDVALSPVLHPAGEADSPRASIRATALGVFDAITAHPWVGAQLTRPPWQATMLDVFELLGREVAALGVPVGMQFTATSTLLLQVIGAGSQQARNSRSPEAVHDRDEYLEQVAGRWSALDPQRYPFTRSVGRVLRGHDDRDEFLAGIDLILDGLTPARRA